MPAPGRSRRARLGVGDRQGQGGPASGSPGACRDGRASGRAAVPLGKTSRNKMGGGKNPRGASGELNPLSRARPGFVRTLQSRGRDAAMQQPSPQQRGLQPPSLTKTCSHLSWSQPLPQLRPCHPYRDSPRAVTSQTKPGHALQEPLPLDAFCQCIAPWSLNTLLAHTQATPSFQTPHCHPTSHPC